MIDRRSILRASASAFAAVGLSRPSSADAPLKIIVPYPAGSGSDVIARVIAAQLPSRINQTVIVLNQSGASGYLATQAIHRADPDGNSIILTSSNHVLLAAVKKNLPFDVVEDFEPITQLCNGPLVVTVNPNFPATTVADLLEMARKTPNTITYASSGTGSAPHLAVELLSVMADVKFVHIPYRGGTPAAADVIAGVVPFYFGSLATSLPFFESHQAIAMAQTPKNRLRFLPNLPTIAEQTGLDYDVQYWYGVLAPPRTSSSRIAQLNQAINEIASTPQVASFIEKQGFGVESSTPAQFKRILKDEAALWIKTARAANIQPE